MIEIDFIQTPSLGLGAVKAMSFHISKACGHIYIMGYPDQTINLAAHIMEATREITGLRFDFGMRAKHENPEEVIAGFDVPDVDDMRRVSSELLKFLYYKNAIEQSQYSAALIRSRRSFRKRLKKLARLETLEPIRV